MTFVKHNWFKLIILLCIVVTTIQYSYLSITNYNKVAWHQAIEECGEKNDLYIKGCLLTENKFYIGNIFKNVMTYCTNSIATLNTIAFDDVSVKNKFNLCSEKLLPELPKFPSITE